MAVDQGPPSSARVSASDNTLPPPRMLGRYALCGEIARGGMATVHFGRLIGPIGFSRTVAIKRLHPRLAADGDFVSMFVDEALLAARIQHPNVVSTLDVIALDGELALVMEYIQGESLSRLMQAVRARKGHIPLRIVGSIMVAVFAGLEAAHAAKNERGEPLNIIHRDMSPQNVIVGSDGVTRVFDFGVARASGRAQTSRVGLFKGKVAYAAPEQFGDKEIDRRIDLYAASVILWEMLASKRMFKADNEIQLLMKVHERKFQQPSVHNPEIPPELDAFVMKGLAANPDERFGSAREMSIAIERMLPIATSREVAEWVHELAAPALQLRAQQVEMIETSTSSGSYIAVSGTQTGSGPVSQPTAPAVVAPGEYSGPQLRTSAPPPREKSRGPWIAAVVVLLALLGVGGFLFYNNMNKAAANSPAAAKDAKSPSDPTPANTKAKSVPEPITVSNVEAPASTAPSATTASDPVADSTATAATAKPATKPVYTWTPPKAKPTTVAATTTPPATTTAAPPVTTAAPAGNCSPPFTIDAQGIKHVKPECL